jgi:hypothetical protein
VVRVACITCVICMMCALTAAQLGARVERKPGPQDPTQFGVVLNWTQSTSPNISGNCTYRSAVSGGPYTQLACIPAATTWQDASPLAGYDYYVVTAVNNQSIESAYSNEAEVFIPTVAPPTDLSGSWEELTPFLEWHKDLAIPSTPHR